MKTDWRKDPMNLSHTWIGCLAQLAPTELRPDEWPSAAAESDLINAAGARPSERLLDCLLAVAYVAACACLGLAGAVWL